MIFFHIKRVTHTHTHTHTNVKGAKQIKSSKLVTLQLAREMGKSNHFYYMVISFLAGYKRKKPVYALYYIYTLDIRLKTKVGKQSIIQTLKQVTIR